MVRGEFSMQGSQSRGGCRLAIASAKASDVLAGGVAMDADMSNIDSLSRARSTSRFARLSGSQASTWCCMATGVNSVRASSSGGQDSALWLLLLLL